MMPFYVCLLFSVNKEMQDNNEINGPVTIRQEGSESVLILNYNMLDHVSNF